MLPGALMAVMKEKVLKRDAPYVEVAKVLGLIGSPAMVGCPPRHHWRIVALGALLYEIVILVTAHLMNQAGETF